MGVFVTLLDFRLVFVINGRSHLQAREDRALSKANFGPISPLATYSLLCYLNQFLFLMQQSCLKTWHCRMCNVSDICSETILLPRKLDQKKLYRMKYLQLISI